MANDYISQITLPDNQTYDINDITKLPLSGGQMVGPLTWKNSTALPEKTAAEYFLAIDSFNSGGKTYWVGKANVLSSIGAAASGHDHNTTYYKLDGSNTGTKLCISTQAAAHTNQIQFMNSTTKKGSIGTDNNGVIGVYGSSKVVLRPVLDASTKGVEVTTSAMYPTASITLGTSTAANKWSTVYATTFDGTTASLTHAQNQSDGLKIKYSTTIDYFIGVGTGNVNHGLYDNKASGGAKWILYAGSDNKWVLDASVAWSNITSKPTTISDYGITDAKIVSDVITLGSSTITPVTSVNGHSGASVNVTASDLGLASALKYVGTKSSLPTATDSTTYSTYNNGDVITVSNKEYAYVKGSNAAGSSWVELGDEGSYKLKQTAFTNSTGTADGSNTSTTFIYSFSQDENGVITNIKTRKLPTYNNYSHPTGDGNLHVPATGTDNNGKFLKAGSTAGSLSWATLTVSDISNIASTYLKLDGSNNMTADVNIIAGDTDKFVNFWYNINKKAGASWRVGMLGSGSSDTNYFVIQSGTSTTSATTWNNTIRIGQNTYDAGFGGNVYPLANNKTLGTTNNKWNTVYATTFDGESLSLKTAASDPSLSAGARILFGYTNATPQTVGICYTPNDTYRNLAGLKIIGGTSASPAWFEVQGSIYADGGTNKGSRVPTTGNNDGSVGGATTPVYVNAGVITAGTTYAGGTAVTLNGTGKGGNTASFYAPTAAGTNGYILKSQGSGAPEWEQEYSVEIIRMTT